MIRSDWEDLCGIWQFTYDDHDAGLRDGWQGRDDVFDREIVVPFPPESTASGIGETGFHPVIWYRRMFTVIAPWLDRRQRIVLHFGAVDYRATVWVNGQLVVTHEGGHTPFSADITAALIDATSGREQVIVVRAEDLPDDLTQPRGKQHWREHAASIFYRRTTGIWQPVWLEPVPERHITNLRWTPDLDRATIGLTVELSRPGDMSESVSVNLTHGDETIIRQAVGIGDAHRRTVSIEINLDHLRQSGRLGDLLWSPDHPTLLGASITAHGSGLPDTVESYVGLRSVGTSGGRFMLNGQPCYLRMALAQNVWPDTLLAATDDTLRAEVEWAKRLGFNTVRIHQKAEDPRFLYWCDRLGLMAWGEMANAYAFSDAAITRFTQEWLAVLKRDVSHPCIVAWVPFNESWGLPNLERDAAVHNFARAIYHLTKAYDPTRPAIANDGWEFAGGDIVGIHDYTQRPDDIRQRYGTYEAITHTLEHGRPGRKRLVLEGETIDNQPVMLTEFGGFAIATNPGDDYHETKHSIDWLPDAAAFLQRYDDLISATLESETLAGFCFTELTDVEQELNGLLTADRQPKADPDAIHDITTRPAKSLRG